MKKRKILLSVLLSVFLLSNAFGIVVAQESDQSQDQQMQDRQVPDQGRFFQSITIVLPANRETWATERLNTSSHGNHITNAQWPAHLIQARIITGTNNSPGSFTVWLNHNAAQQTNRTHHTHLRAGVGIRAQFRAYLNRPQFTSGGSWSP